MKKTEWFDGSKFVPAHVGVYETKAVWVSGGTYQYWNGKFWCAYTGNIGEAPEKHNAYKSAKQNSDWRGLAEKP